MIQKNVLALVVIGLVLLFCTCTPAKKPRVYYRRPVKVSVCARPTPPQKVGRSMCAKSFKSQCHKKPICEADLYEGSLGPTPYRKHGIRATPPTEHNKNKTNMMWMAEPSQAGLNDRGIPMSKVATEHRTPIRSPTAKKALTGPRRSESIPSHV